MAFGNMKTEELVEICKDIREEHIVKACQYIDNNGIPNKRKASTIFIAYDKKEYPLKYTLEIANNEIIKNSTKIGNFDYNPDAWTSLDTIETLIPNPKLFEIISPYNKNNYKLVEKYRKNLINTFIQKGLESKENPSHTVLKLKNNIAEVHFVQKKEAKFKVLINYDLLDEDKRNNLTRVPDKSNWTLNGAYYVTPMESSYKDIVDKINNILKNLSSSKNNKKIKNNKNATMSIDSIPMNLILYGPPGTGKTYNTVIEAMKIIGSKKVKIEEDKQYTNDEYKLLKEEFDNAKDNHQIEFVTFHQSYSYEEFVEGIKPYIPEWGITDNADVKYIGENGIFKEICKNARQIKTDKTSHKIDFSKTRIFKMSLGANWENETEDIYNYCLTNNVVALGWGDDKDFSSCNTSEEFRNLDSTWGAKAVEIFKNWMRVGDIILISNGNSNIKAIAQITGEYEYHNDREIRYCQFRNVNWLYNGDDIPVAKFYDKKLSQQAIYGFYNKDKEGKDDYNSSINTDVLNEIITGNINSAEEKPYILIIDEINRGNISKIFGELITLIEEDKRESLTVTLPYSKEQFTVPKNLHIIGTMNTSDRSIASIDIALRRRFKFKEMMPDSNLVANFGIGFDKIFDELNKKIKLLLDRDHQIGHSYFINTKYNNENGNNNIEILKEIWFSEILPLLNEYFYCDWEKLKLIIPGFINMLDPGVLKNECDDSIYEFKTIEEFKDDKTFENALKQEKFMDN